MPAVQDEHEAGYDRPGRLVTAGPAPALRLLARPAAVAPEWVLVLDDGGQGRGALATSRALAAAGYQVAVGTSRLTSLAASSRSCSKTLRLPEVDDAAYVTALDAALVDGAFRAALVTSDALLALLELSGAELVDKAELSRRCTQLGLPTPDSPIASDPEEGDRLAVRIGYPVVVKPSGRTGRTHCIHDAAAWRGIRSWPVVVQPFLQGEPRSVSGVIRGGQLVAVVHQRYLRSWPLECGTSCAAITTERVPELEAVVQSLLEEHDGLFQAQFVANQLIDVNPRPYGSLPLALAAGVNLPALAVGPHDVNAAIRVARAGVRYRWIEGDVRHVATALRRGSLPVAGALQALRPHRDVAHSVASWRDPQPQLRRLRNMLRHA